MAELHLRLDPVLSHAGGSPPGDAALGAGAEGSPLPLHADWQFSSLSPSSPAGFDWTHAAAWLHGAGVDAVVVLQWFFLLYFIILNGGYTVRNVASLLGLFRYVREHGYGFLPRAYSDYEPPISIVVPVRDEEATIAARVRALQQLDYPEFEIVLVNDGSRDRTLEVLLREFSLTPFPEAYRDRLQSRRVKTIYASALNSNLRLVDKDNGGRADALNAGINCARYALFCGVDADTILQRDALRRMARPFLERDATVASCATMRPANGATSHAGLLGKAGLSRNLLALLQTVESLRAFLFGRFGWSPLNALLVFAPTFGVFRREAVIAAGGYRSGVPEENMDLVVRLHHLMLQGGERYRVDFVPDPVCWGGAGKCGDPARQAYPFPDAPVRGADSQPGVSAARQGRAGAPAGGGLHAAVRLARTPVRGLRVCRDQLVMGGRRDFRPSVRGLHAARRRSGHSAFGQRRVVGGNVLPPLSRPGQPVETAGGGRPGKLRLPPNDRLLAPGRPAAMDVALRR